MKTYTVGMEIESEYCIDVFVRDKLPPGWQIVHDASIKSSVRVNNLGEKSRMSSSQRSSDPFYTMGSEIISPVFNVKDFDLTKIRRDLCYITNLIQENGEPEKTWRSGIHIHVGLPEVSLYRLKSIIQLGRYMEDVFFQISGQGYQFRGQFFNKCLYCRPITKKGPQVFYLNDDEGNERLIQLFNVHDLLSANSIVQFWDRYGGCTRDRQRWHPVRYSWLNLYSILYRGTLE
ncbi:MAG: hypothetical protein GYA16_14615, partial [Spirochaetes bacterium]|nr:hypothetical protein [Spirochaetota bacterium]